MRKLVIERAAVKHNLSIIKERAAGAVIYGVLTGDGGGAGIVPMAKLLRAEGIGRFAVYEVKEAEKLRQAGFEDEEILMLRSTTDREELEQLVDLNVVCTISSVDTGLALNALAENRATVACAHIQVDTGMGFGGFLVSEPEKILLAYRSLSNVALEGIYTQLHAARVKFPQDGEQMTGNGYLVLSGADAFDITVYIAPLCLFRTDDTRSGTGRVPINIRNHSFHRTFHNTQFCFRCIVTVFHARSFWTNVRIIRSQSPIHLRLLCHLPNHGKRDIPRTQDHRTSFRQVYNRRL